MSFHVRGAIPPTETKGNEYGWPCVPCGSGDVLLIEIAGQAMVSESCFCAITPRLSSTCTVTAEVPDIVGVPLMTPVESRRLRDGELTSNWPGGRAPVTGSVGTLQPKLGIGAP